MRKIKSINPSNYEIVGEVEVSSEQDIKDKIDLTNKAKEGWFEIGVDERIKHVKKIRDLFFERKDEIAELISKEMGMPIDVSKGGMDWDFGYFDWFIENVKKSIADEITSEDEGKIHKVVYEPIGTVAAITPWNLPFDLFMWSVIPNLLVGNTVVHKASEECILTGKLFEDIMNDADLPKGVFGAIHGDGEQGQILVDQDIDMIWFTGSTEVGKILYKKAADKFIKAALEMGGSNPGIVFEDYDPKVAAGQISAKRFSYCGQTCDALKRLLVHENIFDDVVAELKKEIEKIKLGDAMDEKVEMGPLASKTQMELLDRQVKESVDAGAKIITGGNNLEEKLGGAYFEPTLMTDIEKNMRVWSEETFGPVLPVMKFSTEEEAIQIANDTNYGLGSCIYTNDKDKAKQIASKIKAGNVSINGTNHFLACNPFGGYKESGIGREHGIHGFRELCQIKVISEDK